MEQATCKNCNIVLIDVYCHKCGQKASTSRITLKSLWHEVVHSLTHVEKGFLYTSIELFIHPGKVINGYLAGKRVQFHKPFGLYFIWVAIFLLVDNFLKEKTVDISTAGVSSGSSLEKAWNIVFPLYEHYLALFILPLIFLTPLLTYPLFFKKLGYNYAEIIIISIYIQVTGFIIAIFVDIFGALTDTHSVFQDKRITLLIGLLIQLWIFFDVIKGRSFWKSALLSLLIVALGYLLFFIYLWFIIPFIVYFFI